ncbi:glucose-6-phosphate dehydrogenase [Angustibacter speluncae]
MTASTRTPAVLVLFGATGDLASRSLHPALYALEAAGELPGSFAVVGSGRHAPGEEGDDPDDAYRAQVRDDVRAAVDDADDDVLARLLERMWFRTADADDDDVNGLVQHVRALAADAGDAQVVTYFSVPPDAVRGMTSALHDAGLLDGARLVLEKPFGLDLGSWRALRDDLHAVVPEDRTYRVDHFLAGGTARELLTGAPDPEGWWGREHVAQVQVDVPETLRMEGRGSFYEDTGCLRDMVVDHLLGLVSCLAADDVTEPATERSVRDARVAALRTVRPLRVDEAVYGQYDGYRDEDDVDDDSQVETFVAARLHLDHPRWQGVPVHLRTGKALAADTSTITLRRVGGLDQHLEVDTGEAYQRVLLGVLDGDRTWFVRDDEADLRWGVCEPLVQDPPPVHRYEAGSWGPPEALALPTGGWHLT